MVRSSSPLSEVWVRRSAVWIVMTFAVSVSVAAQDGFYINNEPLNCETTLVVQDLVNAHVLQAKDGLLIVLVHSGKGEDSRLLMQRRLFNLRQSFKNGRGSMVPSDRVVVAEGERASGPGRVDYYFDGKLYARLVFYKQGFLCHSCCGPDERYYPDKARMPVLGKKSHRKH